MDKLDKIKLELAEAMDFNNLYHSKEFQQRLLPLLIKDSQQLWLDPTKEGFEKAYTMAFAKAEVAKGWIDFLSKQESRVASLQKQIDTPDKNYAI